MTPESERSGQDQVPEIPPVLILPTAVERALDESDDSLGALGRPFDHRAPFFVGLNAALGVAVAYVIVRGIADITTVLVIIGLALFIAIGLNPVIELLDESGTAPLDRRRNSDTRIHYRHRGIRALGGVADIARSTGSW